MLEPFNINLNTAAMLFASWCWPLGYQRSASITEAAESLEALNDQVARLGSPVIWTGGSEATIFGDSEVNLDFRAWHDFHHYKHALPFTLEGETVAAFAQCADVVNRYGPDTEMLSLLLCEIIGQARAYDRTGKFPVDQRAFTLGEEPKWRPLAEYLAEKWGDGTTYRAAILEAHMWLVDVQTLRELQT